MKRIFLMICILAWASACASVEIPALTGTVPLSDMRLSLLSGTAFVDHAAADLANFVGYRYKVCSVTDSTQCATGYIKSAGTGQTYGSELLTNGNMASGDPPTWWQATRSVLSSETGAGNYVTSPGVRITIATGQTNGNINSPGVDVPAGALVLFTGSYKSGTATQVFWKISGTSGGSRSGDTINPATMTAYSTYFTNETGNTGIWTYPAFVYGTAGQYAYADDVSLKRVLTTSVTGVVIVSERGGATQSWTSNTFTTRSNDTAGFTYSVYPRSPATALPTVPDFGRLDTLGGNQ